MSKVFGDLVIAGIVAFLLLGVLHLFPWRRLINGQGSAILDPPWSYVCGTLALGLVYTGLLIAWWSRGDVLIVGTVLTAFWTVIGCGGGAVLVGYWFDAYLERKAKAKDAKAKQELDERHWEE